VVSKSSNRANLSNSRFAIGVKLLSSEETLLRQFRSLQARIPVLTRRRQEAWTYSPFAINESETFDSESVVENTMTQLERVFNSEQPELFAEELRAAFQTDETISTQPKNPELLEGSTQ
jgi:hypothetical protein